MKPGETNGEGITAFGGRRFALSRPGSGSRRAIGLAGRRLAARAWRGHPAVAAALEKTASYAPGRRAKTRQEATTPLTAAGTMIGSADAVASGKRRRRERLVRHIFRRNGEQRAGLRAWAAGLAVVGIGVAIYIAIADAVAGRGVSCGGTVARPSPQQSLTRIRGDKRRQRRDRWVCRAARGCAARGDLARFGGFVAALVGFGFSAYLTYLELFVIDAIRQWCVASAVDDPVSAVTAACVFATSGSLACIQGTGPSVEPMASRRIRKQKTSRRSPRKAGRGAGAPAPPTAVQLGGGGVFIAICIVALCRREPAPGRCARRKRGPRRGRSHAQLRHPAAAVPRSAIRRRR